MRLLKTAGSDSLVWVPQLVDFRGEDYAILSHRWAKNANDEVLFADIEIIDDGGKDENTGLRRNNFTYNTGYGRRWAHLKDGYKKLKGAAKQALTDNHAYIWVDTCCIDKSSSAELSEAINSMWAWYDKSQICYAYLSDIPGDPDEVDTSLGSEFRKSQWWSRGWTLQELIAPSDVWFYSNNWDRIGEKKSLADAILETTGIGMDVLTKARRLESVSIAKRMSWASHRQTTRIEDMAYCLMGIFSVNMPLLYGEGDKAFLRLQQEIMRDSDDESIFAWVEPSAQPETPSGLLANHPKAFSNSGEITYYWDFEDRDPYLMSNRGLSITVQLTRAEDATFAAALHCPVPSSGDGFLAIYLRRLGKNSQHYARVKCARLGALDKRGPLATIYVRQSHPTHELDTVLPYHFFQLRHGPAESERYFLVNAMTSNVFSTTTPTLPSATPHAQRWVPSRFQPTIRVAKGPAKLSAVLLFSRMDDEGEEARSQRLAIMLGSISTTQVGFDAYEINHLDELSEMEKMFKPRSADDNWIELEKHSVKVEIEPKSDGSYLLFLTDITISSINRVSPALALAEAMAHKVEPLVPAHVRAMVQKRPGGRAIWKRLGNGR